MHNQLYDYSPITQRAQFSLPGDKLLAFYVGLNIEHFHVDLLSRGQTHIPEPMAYGRRDYGPRVGIWRLIEIFDEVGMPVSAITNSEVCTYFPQIIEAGTARQWAWIAHGQTNSRLHAEMALEEERAELQQMVETFDGALPARPVGWLGPGLSETFNTPALLRDLGFTYLLDWCCDDQPFPLNVPGMIGVPYSLDINDISLLLNGNITGPQYERVVLDQFEGLLADAHGATRIMALPLHPYVTGQTYLSKYLKRVLREIASTQEVWLCTSDEIAAAYSQQFQQAQV